MTYTPSPIKTASATSNFTNLRKDQINQSIQVANSIVTQDATASPVTSPVTVNTTATLAVPNNAVSVVLCSVTNAVQVSEDSTQSTFFTLPAAVVQCIPCANQKFIYLKTGSSTVVSFMFNLV